jgi:hypothetical protein
VADESDGPSVEPAEPPWPQRALDNLWLLLALSVLIPAVLYLAWGLWELAELSTWGGS